MEPFVEGDTVRLTHVDQTLGHVVHVSADGRSVDVRWQRNPGHDHEVTAERTDAIRRVHESEDGTL
jgi:hypothetical protein